MSGSVKLGPSKMSWNISLGNDETGHCAPLPVEPVPTAQVSVNILQAGRPLMSSPEWMRQLEVAKEVLATSFDWNSVGSKGRSLVVGMVAGVIESVPAACAMERS